MNAKDEEGWTPLHRAADRGRKEIAELLIASDAEVNAKANNEDTPLDFAGGATAELLLKHGGKSDSILVAARVDDLAGVQALLDSGADVNAKDENDMTALHWTAEKGHEVVVYLLISEGADVNAKDENDMTALHWTAHKGHWEIAELLIAKGADVNGKNENGWTPLHWAADRGRKEIAELLIASDAEVNAKANDGKTPLDMANGATADLLRTHGGHSGSIHGAARGGDIEAVKDFLASGADMNAKDKNGRSALHWAASGGHEVVVYLLISEGADVNAKSENRLTPLHYAADYGHREIIELLLAKGADVNAKDENRLTPLHYAAYGDHKEIVELLIAKGADVNAKKKNGKTPLDMASGATADLLRTHGGHSGSIHVSARDGDLAGVQALLDIGADVNAKDEEGWTPLHYSARNGHEEIVELLISGGADVNVKDESEETAVGENVETAAIICHHTGHSHGGKTIHVPARDGDLAVVQYLLDAGADVNAKDEHGWTALHYAAFSVTRKLLTC